MKKIFLGIFCAIALLQSVDCLSMHLADYPYMQSAGYFSIQPEHFSNEKEFKEYYISKLRALSIEQLNEVHSDYSRKALFDRMVNATIPPLWDDLQIAILCLEVIIERENMQKPEEDAEEIRQNLGATEDDSEQTATKGSPRARHRKQSNRKKHKK